MASKKHGKNTSILEITHISPNGIWLYLDEKEHFLSYKDFPWFKKATLEEIYDVKRINQNHLHWEKLDVDLNTASIQHPEKFPLISK